MIRTATGLARTLAMVTLLTVAGRAQTGTEAKIYDVLVRGNATPGYYLMAPTTNTNLSLADHGGWLVHRRPETSTINLQRHPDGSYTYFVPRVGHIRLDSTFERTIDTVNSIKGSTDFHELKILRNGNYLVLGAMPRTVDMSKVVDGGKVDAVVGDALLEEQRPDGTVVWSWNSKDHVNILDATPDIELKGGTVDYIHVNSVIEDTDGNLIVSARHFDEVFKINRQTGAIAWRLGGKASKHNQFRWLNDTVNGYWGFSHQHTVSRTSDGHLLLFDNGNLKSPEYSRAVEYEIDEVNKTVRRVWQYRPAKDIASRTMGSVERLPNGGTLICWGRNFAKMILTELDSADNVLYELMNDASTNVASYRATKYQVRMLAEQFHAQTEGVTHVFRSGGTSLGVQATVNRLGRRRTITVERHTYGPLGASFNGDAPLLTDSLRWTLRTDLAAGDSVGLTFDVRGVSGVCDPKRAVLWYRPFDGTGALRRVATVRDASTGALYVGSCDNGEYAIGYDVGTVPVPATPVGGATADSVPVALTWRGAVKASAYEVQVSADSTFQTPVASLRSASETAVAQGLSPATTYQWRVRAVGGGADSSWSFIAMFRTPLDRPSIVEPRSNEAIPPERVGVVWTTVARATAYRATIVDTSSDVLLDTTLVDTSLILDGRLPGDARLVIDVQALAGPAKSYRPASRSLTTLPYKPTDMKPTSGTVNVGANVAQCTWHVRGTASTHLQVRRFEEDSLIVDDTTDGTSSDLPTVDDCRMYQWRVRAIGQHGESAWTPFLWFATAGTPTVTPPELELPSDGTTVDASNVVLSWSGGMSSLFGVQIDTTASFAGPIVDTFTAGTSIRVTKRLPEDQPLFWRVYETTTQYCGSWSGTRQFTVPGSGLGPLSPTNGAVDVPVSGDVRYTTSGRFTDYRVEFYLDTADDEPERIYASTTNQCRYVDLQLGTWYRWHVLGTMASGETEIGPWSRFRTRDAINAVDEDREGTVVMDEDGITYRGPDARLAQCVVFDVLGRQLAMHVTQATDDATTWMLSSSYDGGVVYVCVRTFGVRRHYSLQPSLWRR